MQFVSFRKWVGDVRSTVMFVHTQYMSRFCRGRDGKKRMPSQRKNSYVHTCKEYDGNVYIPVIQSAWGPIWRSLSHWKGHLTIPKRSQRRCLCWKAFATSLGKLCWFFGSQEHLKQPSHLHQFHSFIQNCGIQNKICWMTVEGLK